jgi:serine/threonine protein kinase
VSDEEFGFDPTRTGDPLIGAALGEYVVRSRMGVGGMGVVYRGEQPLIGKTVAIKVMRAEYSDDPKLAQKFLEEARAVSAATHPNIIEIYGFGATRAGQQYLVMELLDGEPLDVYLRNEGGRLPIEEALALLKQVAAGLQAAHEAGVIHRDLKPPNLFLVRLADGTRYLKLLDFGLAKRATADGTVRPTANVVVGTPLYMAPEQVNADVVSPATDLYALGCIAYELVAGKPPFFAESVLQLLELQKSGVAERVRVDGVPEEYFDLVFELLRKDMRERPQTAAEVKKRLEALERLVLPPPTQVALQRPTRIQPPPQLRDTDEGHVPPTSPSLPALPRESRLPGVLTVSALLLGAVAVAGAFVVMNQPAPDASAVGLRPAATAPLAVAPPAPKTSAEPPTPAEAPPPKQRAPAKAAAQRSAGATDPCELRIDRLRRHADKLPAFRKRMVLEGLDVAFHKLESLGAADCNQEVDKVLTNNPELRQ